MSRPKTSVSLKQPISHFKSVWKTRESVWFRFF